jgi:methionyl aminopeptidase
LIVVKSPEEIELMRECGSILATILAQVKQEVRPGIRTSALDEMVVEEMKKWGVVASFKGYHGYPASLCVSINDEVVHGIPGARVVQEGDVVSLDLGVLHRGFHTDAAVTVGAGELSSRDRKLIEVTEGALEEGLSQAREGNHVGDISAAIQRYTESNGLAVVREYTGHGVGRELHEEPQVPNFECGKGPLLRKGMTLAVEPMVTNGGWRTRVAGNKWTVLTTDGSSSAHFEHSIGITDGAPVVFA